MGTQLFSTLCILSLIVGPSRTPTQGNRKGVNGMDTSSMSQGIQDSGSGEIWEPEMQAIWLVENTEAFGVEGKASDHDRSLDLRLTYQEWLAIFLDALEVDKAGYEKWASKKVVVGQTEVTTVLTELDEEVPGYPMLSRIRGPHHDVAFERNELEALYQECSRVKARTTNPLALKALEKLIHAYDQARQFGLSVYFVSN